MIFERELRVALVGAGRIGTLHAENLAQRLPDVCLAAIADPNLDNAHALAGRLHVSRAVSNHAALLDDSSIDAIVISSTTDTHVPIAIDAASAGKHIFCEKPIDFKLARIDRVLSAVERARVVFQVGFNRRFDPNFRKLRDSLTDGRLGAPHLLRITSRDRAPPAIDYVKSSGGLFMDMSIHDFDMARFLIDSAIEEVFAAGSVLVDPAIEQCGDVDTALVMLRFHNGALGVIDNSRRAVYGYDQRVEVFGSGGMVIAENNVRDTTRIVDEYGVHASLPQNFFIERYRESYVAEMAHFVACVRDRKQPDVGGNDGRLAALIAHAAEKSMRENRPVSLREPSYS